MTLRTKLPNRCKHCKVRMPADKARHVLHDDCIDPWLAVQKIKEQKVKAKEMAQDKRETKAKLDKLKSRSTWAKEAQTAFNAWVRARDAGSACISCGRHHQGQNHAGHYLSVGARPELRYEPLNVWLQCAPCNTHLSGNAVLYRQALLLKIGADKLNWLEGHHPTRHYTTDELKAIKADYTARARELQKGMS